MTKITEFNKPVLKRMRDELNEVLAKYGKKAGLEFEVGNIRFFETECDIKMKAKVSGAVTHTDEVLISFVNTHKLVMTRGGRTLTGYKRANHTYPILYTENGRNFKTTIERAKVLFAA